MVLKAPYFTKNNKEGGMDKGIGVTSEKHPLYIVRVIPSTTSTGFGRMIVYVDSVLIDM